MSRTRHKSPRAGNSLAERHPEIAAEFDEEANGFSAREVGSSSTKKWQFRCRAHGHVWRATAKARTVARNGCPICANLQVHRGFNDLLSQFPDVAAEFDVKANGMEPDEVIATSRKKAAFKCSAHGHTWSTIVNSRTNNGHGCPFCSNKRVWPGFNDLLTRYPIVAAEFDVETNGTTPDQVMPGSNKVFSFNCSKYGHAWTSKLNDRTSGGQGCPTCDGKRILPGFNDLQTRFPDIASDFDIAANGITPDQVMPGSTTRYQWRCATCMHTWRVSPNGRTNGLRRCPSCAKRNWRTEGALRSILSTRYSGTHPQAHRLPQTLADRKRNTWECDIVIERPGLPTIVVELDGERWHAQSVAQDLRKSTDLRSQGYIVVRLRVGKLGLLHPHDLSVPSPLVSVSGATHIADLVADHLASLGFPPDSQPYGGPADAAPPNLAVDGAYTLL